MPDVFERRRALPLPLVAELREKLLTSPFVARSTLAGSFRHSRGFAITFTAEGRPQLESRFPFLTPYLDLALSREAGRRLEPWWRRSRTPVIEANAFYLNLLLISEGGSVGRHVDATLREPAGVDHVVPVRVSVLYLEVPQRKGGELRLFRGGRLTERVRPEVGKLVWFRGDLDHEVTPVEAAPEGTERASLVCEQYALPTEALTRLELVHVQSKAGFAAYLADASARGTSTPHRSE